jgi:hypothetical protein
MAIPKSARDLMSGSGTVSGSAGSRLLSFLNTQYFKEGATVKITVGGQDYTFTIDVGADKSWETLQAMPTGVNPSNVSFYTTQTSTSRARGSSGVIVPGAMHFVYRAVNDDSGNPDWFFYFDTIFPENGVHPYTRDQYTGQSWLGSITPGNVGPALIPNLGIRIRILEGALRGDPSVFPAGTTNPDARIADLHARILALETWANSVGHFGTPPAVGTASGAATGAVAAGSASAGAYGQDNLQSYGDIA